MRDNNQTAHFKFVLLLYAFFPRKSLQTTLEDCKYRFVIKLLARAIKRKPQPEKTRLFLLFRKRINQPTNHAEAKALERKHAHTKKKKNTKRNARTMSVLLWPASGGGGAYLGRGRWR